MKGIRTLTTNLTNCIALIGLIGTSVLILTAAIATNAQTKSLGENPEASFSKVFLPNTIGPGSVSTITFTITNNTGSPLTGLAFTDVLPTVPGDVDIADPANASTDCLNGIVTAPDGGGTITFSGGDLGDGESCTVTVDVTAGTPGVHTNPAITLTYNELGGDPPTSSPADLTVDTALPGFSKSFAPTMVPLGGKSTLTFSIDNMANGSNVVNLDFTDNLPTGMEIADPANASTTCGTAVLPPTLTAVAGTSVITLDANGISSFPALAAGASCTVSVEVTATAGGELNNISDNLLAEFVVAGKASDTLDVSVTALAIRKAFTDDPVPPGGTTTLEFTIDNFDRNFPATGVAFTDDLTTALAGLTFDSLLSNDCGGSVSGVGGTTIGFSGGTLAAEGLCTIRVSLTVPAGATPGVYTNTTGAVTGTVDGSPVVGNMASDDLFVEPVPILTKEFLDATTMTPDPVVNAGDDVTLRFTVTNTSTTSMATDVAFLDELTDGSSGFPPDPTTGFLPFPVTVSLPPIPDPPCGTGSSLALVSVDTDRQGLELTGGTLAAAGMTGDSCTFEVTLTIPTDLGPGIYLNTTEEPSATVDGATRTGRPASDTLTVIAAPALTKVFSDDPVAPGGSVTLEFTLTYSPDAAGDATAISFTDDLAALAPPLAGLTATGLPLAAACDPDGPGGNPGTGTLSGSVGDTLLTFMGGTLSPGESCTFSVTLDVPTGAAPGLYTNTTSGVSATVGGLAATSAPANDTLNVSGVRFMKEFLDDPVIAGDTVTLRFTIDNIHPTDDATITFFSDNLAANLPGLAATGPPSVNECGGGLSGTTFLIYTGGSVLSGTSCTIEVEVLVPPGSADGNYLNVTSGLSTSLGTIVPATDTLTVNSNLLQLTKEFTDDPVAPGGTVNLRFTLTNLDTSNAASAIGFTDDLNAALAGLMAPGPLSTGTCSGTLTGTSLLTYSGGGLSAGGSCSFDVSLNVPAGAPPNSQTTNTTSSVTGTLLGFAVTGDPATDDLMISSSDNIAPVLSYTPIPSTHSTANPTLSVTISDAVGVDRATIFFSINGAAFTSNLCSLATGTQQSGTWDCTIPGTLTNPSAIAYFVAAQDTALNTTSIPAAGASTPNLFTIGAGTVPAGTYTNMSLASGATFAGDANIFNILELGGIISTGGNTVTLGCGTTVVGGGPTSYVIGSLAKLYCSTGSFTYPVGTVEDGTVKSARVSGLPEYSPFTADVTAVGTVPSTLTVNVTDAVLAGSDAAESASRYWDVTENGDITANISFSYLDQDVAGVETGYQVLRRTSGVTGLFVGGSVNAGSNTGSASNVTDFSQWAAGTLAAPVDIGGRVTTPSGAGISAVNITLTRPDGDVIIRRTNPMGYYRFFGIVAGSTYTVTATSKGNSFVNSPRMLFIDADNLGIDFVSTGGMMPVPGIPNRKP